MGGAIESGQCLVAGGYALDLLQIFAPIGIARSDDAQPVGEHFGAAMPS